VGDIEFYVIFVIENSSKITKNGFGKKNYLYNQFTLGPMA
jgi:hypothetical protein